jgi:hypothetical protein
MIYPLLVGSGVMLVSLLIYGLATALIVQLAVPLLRKKTAGPMLWKNVAVLMAVSVVTALVHLIQVALWAVVFLMVGELSTFENAFYCSAENYTALGYGDLVLSERWRLLGPLEAINGLLLFGLSTAVIFAVMSRLIVNRLRHQQPRSPRRRHVPGTRGSATAGKPRTDHQAPDRATDRGADSSAGG